MLLDWRKKQHLPAEILRKLAFYPKKSQTLIASREAFSYSFRLSKTAWFFVGQFWFWAKFPPFQGDTTTVLSITEAFAGSDVAGLRTTAVLDASGEPLGDAGLVPMASRGLWSWKGIYGCFKKKGTPKSSIKK